MSPQAPSFNRVIWGKLEEKVRSWANLYSQVFIVTGGVLDGQKLGTIGANKVTIPKYYYKTVLRADGNSFTCIALVLPNEAGSMGWSNYVISVDSLEKLTLIDFYAGLPDNIEKVI